MDVIQRQGKSSTAEQAIKLTVYEAKTTESETPVNTAPPVEASSDIVDEPFLREATPQAQKVNDVSDIVKKWSTK
jgi:hypothetical protein